MKKVVLLILLACLAALAVPSAASADPKPTTPSSSSLKVAASPVPSPTGGHQVTLTWTAASDAIASSTYTVYRISGTCPGTVTLSSFTAITPGVTGTTSVDSTVTPGLYCYVVTQVQGGAESAPSNTAQATIKPFAPTNLTAVAQ